MKNDDLSCVQVHSIFAATLLIMIVWPGSFVHVHVYRGSIRATVRLLSTLLLLLSLPCELYGSFLSCASYYFTVRFVVQFVRCYGTFLR